jgi:hypothetical protein
LRVDEDLWKGIGDVLGANIFGSRWR